MFFFRLNVTNIVCLRYRTIMSYNCNKHVKRVNYFSNPDVSYLNKATGTATENNALTIKENMVRARNHFRSRASRGMYSVAEKALTNTYHQREIH